MTGKSFAVESTEPKAPPLALQRRHRNENEAAQPRRADATLVQALPMAAPQTGPVDSPAAPHLVLLSGAESGRQFWFRATVTTIGRARDNAVVIPEMGVSRHHARIERDAQAIVLRDARSGNGTRVNGRKTTRRSLRDGDVVQVGATRLRFVDPDRRRSRKLPYAPAALAVAVVTATILAAFGGRIAWQRRQAERREQAQLERDAAEPGTAVAAPQIGTAAAQSAAVAMQAAAQPAAVSMAAATPAAADAAAAVQPPWHSMSPASASRPAKDTMRSADAGAHDAAVERASRPRAAKVSAQRPHASSAATSAAPVAERPPFEEARREGMARMAENKLPEALRAFEEARRENPTAELARIIASLHVRIGLSLMSSEAKLPAAAAAFRAALDDEPQNPQAAQALREIEARCHELYLRGYVAKEDDPATAMAAFRIVISALPPEDQTAQKARHWLTKLDGKALIDD